MQESSSTPPLDNILENSPILIDVMSKIELLLLRPCMEGLFGKLIRNFVNDILKESNEGFSLIFLGILFQSFAAVT